MNDTPHEPPVILLAEDNPGDAQLALYALRAGGWTHGLVWVKDGEEGIEWFFGEGRHAGRHVEEQPRLALLDIQMPRLSGIEVLERLKADPRTADIPVVIFTSFAGEEIEAQARALGAVEFLQKPVDFDKYEKAKCDW